MKITVINNETLDAIDITNDRPLSLAKLFVSCLNINIKELLKSLIYIDAYGENNPFEKVHDLLCRHGVYPEYTYLLMYGAVLYSDKRKPGSFSNEDKKKVRYWNKTKKVDRELFIRLNAALLKYFTEHGGYYFLHIKKQYAQQQPCQNSERNDSIVEEVGSFPFLLKPVVYSFNYYKGQIHETFEFEDIASFLIFAHIKALQSKVSIKICENCGDLFTPTSRSDEKYCDKIIDGKSCKDIGYYNKLQNNESLEATKEYRKAYKTKNAYKNRNLKNCPHADNDFKIWASAAKQNLLKVQSESISLEEFKDWLKKQ